MFAIIAAKYALIVSAIAVAAIRPFLLFHELGEHAMSSYMAFAHLLVGFLVGSWCQSRMDGQIPGATWRDWRSLTAIGLTIVEVVCTTIKIVS